MDLSFVVVAAFIGGLVAATLGYLESGDVFNSRKFGSSMIRSIVAAVVFGVSYHFTNHLQVIDVLYAFLGGAGVDVLGNRLAGTLKKEL